MDDSRPAPHLPPSLTGTLVRRGVWSADEHDRFLQALKRFPDGPWQQLALCVGTRSTRQVQTHAQKFFEKIRRRQRGLRRSYVHTGMAREHRVDDDVVAILSAMPQGDKAAADDNDDDDENDEEEEEEDDSDNSRDENADATNSTSTGLDGDADGADDKASSVSSSTATPRSRGKRKRSRSQETSKSDEALPPTLPRRIRIRRSARNTLHLAAHREQFLAQAMHLDTEVSHQSEHCLAEITAVDPVDPSHAELPSIEEALDFFLHTIDADSAAPSHHPRLPKL